MNAVNGSLAGASLKNLSENESLFEESTLSAWGVGAENSSSPFVANAFAAQGDRTDIFAIRYFECQETISYEVALIWEELGRSDRIGCFCNRQSYVTLSRDKSIRGMCYEHMMRLLRQTAAFVLGSVVVVIMNIFLELSLVNMSMWAKPLSITAMNASLMWKLF